jgi:hypothetical protein
MSKNIVETEGPQITSQLGAYALRAGLERLYARMRMHTPTRSGTHMHVRTRKHAHKDQYVILITFPRPQWFRERALMFRYTYIACLVGPVHVTNRTKLNGGYFLIVTVIAVSEPFNRIFLRTEYTCTM